MLELIKQLREESGAGVVDVKKALDEAGGDIVAAREILRKKGQAKALKKADRVTSEGFIGSYVHSNGKIAALVALNCETDFVARNADFQALARDIAMHVAASNPSVVSADQVDAAVVAHERDIWTEQMAGENKPADIVAKIMEGKEKKFREEQALLTQSFVKDPDHTVGEVIAEKIAVMGEKITVGSFTRLSL